MKKLALGLILAVRSAGVYTQGADVAGTTNVVAGGSAAGAGGAVAAGSKTETTTSH